MKMGTLDVNKSMDVVKVQLRSFTWLTGQCMPLTSGTPSPSLKIPFKLGRCSSQEGPINPDKTPNDNVTSSIIEMKIRERERGREFHSNLEDGLGGFSCMLQSRRPNKFMQIPSDDVINHRNENTNDLERERGL